MSKVMEYVDNLFMAMPKTPEVLSLKANIADSLEEKYQVLLGQGKNSDEALGIIVSEFGSMEELCKEYGGFGIDLGFSQLNAMEKEYYSFQKNFGLAIAIGVVLCILGAIVTVFVEEILDLEDWGIVFGFLLIAPAVFLFVYFGIQSGRYEDVKKEIKRQKKLRNQQQ